MSFRHMFVCLRTQGKILLHCMSGAANRAGASLVAAIHVNLWGQRNIGLLECFESAKNWPPAQRAPRHDLVTHEIHRATFVKDLPVESSTAGRKLYCSRSCENCTVAAAQHREDRRRRISLRTAPRVRQCLPIVLRTWMVIRDADQTDTAGKHKYTGSGANLNWLGPDGTDAATRADGGAVQRGHFD